MTTLQDLFLEELADMYYAQIQLNVAFSRMARAVRLPGLRAAIEPQAAESLDQIRMIEAIFHCFGQHPRARRTEAITCLLRSGWESIVIHDGSPTVDAAIVGAIRKVQYFRIASYECLLDWSHQLGSSVVSAHLHAILGQLRIADEVLAEFSEAHWREDCNGYFEAGMAKRMPWQEGAHRSQAVGSVSAGAPHSHGGNHAKNAT